MDQNALKAAAADAAITHLQHHLPANTILGVGTGSTVNLIIDRLTPLKTRIRAAVSSSEASTRRLIAQGIPVLDLNSLPPDAEIPIYIDGADEITPQLHMTKGGGGALTREKILASAARQFICVCDASKEVSQLGAFPLPIEIIPLARTHLARRLAQDLGARPVWRENFVTDNGNHILDLHGLTIPDPIALETRLNQYPGIVTCGLFAQRGADLLISARPDGIHTRNKTATKP